jgi:hypothetical protein
MQYKRHPNLPAVPEWCSNTPQINYILTPIWSAALYRRFLLLFFGLTKSKTKKAAVKRRTPKRLKQA